MCETKNDGMTKKPLIIKMSSITNEKDLHELFNWIIICWNFF